MTQLNVLKESKELAITLSFFLMVCIFVKNIICVHSYEMIREAIPKKKLLNFGHCPKVALTPPPRFGHLWGNFRLSRFQINLPPKNYLFRNLKVKGVQ